MKVRKKEIFEAEQWFPGKQISGIRGTDPNRWCGCIISGSKQFDKPHFHPSPATCELVNPGDWIVKDVRGNKCLIKPDVFINTYERV